MVRENCSTEGEIKVCTWLREISSLLNCSAWVLPTNANKPLFPPLYINLTENLEVGPPEADPGVPPHMDVASGQHAVTLHAEVRCQSS